MGDLSAVPQEKIVDYLLERLERGQFYTWVGTLLLAINPNGEIVTENHTYDLWRAREYDNICDVTNKEVSPHIFAVAARAHYRIVQGLGKPSQVIVLNGETGTGKTFNAWKALEFLTRSVSSPVRERRDAVCGIVRRISDACRLISAFTTAPTERNRVSSRHVQLVWLEYKMGCISGATISSYLLERDRVTKGCCNFQIFGQLMAAVANVNFTDTELRQLPRRGRRYFMANDFDPLRAEESLDGFHKTLRAMDLLGFTECQKKDIFHVLSLLIYMGDIRFVQEDDRCSIDIDDQQSKEALENACQLACVKEEDIAELLTSILINPQNNRRRHTICRRNLNTSDACRYRLHSIIRHLYDLLFHWLINCVNDILSSRLYSERLGILDIFGFECFDSNGIEQLCINYVNERLQQYFVEKYLLSCRNDLQREGLIGDDEESSDIVRSYVERISTIEKYLFASVNDMCLSTVPSNSTTLIRQVCAKSCPATRQFLTVRNDNFIVRHYGGAVEYSVCDLLSKNTDKIPDEIIVTFSVSTNKFLYSLIVEGKPYHDGKAKKPTMLSKLRSNVDTLIQELNKCDTHYVRCIKPQRLNNYEWNRDELRKQLANTGVLDALPLARCKYPIQFIYKDFFRRYSRRRTETCDTATSRSICKNILESFRLTMDDENASVHYGKRLIFLRESMFLRLESARRRYRAECVRKIELCWLKYKNLTQYSEKNSSDRTIVDMNIQNEPTDESKSESNEVVPVLGISLCAENLVQDMQENMEDAKNNSQAIIKYQPSRFERALLEYERVIPIEDVPQFVPTGKYIEMLMNIAKKTAYTLHWLDGVRNVKPSILELLREEYNYNHSIDGDCTKDIQLQEHKPSNNEKRRKYTRNRRGKTHEHYNEEEDMYVIQYGNFTLFYKNRILSRRRPARLPIRIHTRLRCLANSHCLVHTELPQGLQDCL